MSFYTRYAVRRENGAWHVFNPAGERVLDTRRFGVAVWLADNFAKRAAVHAEMRRFTDA